MFDITFKVPYERALSCYESKIPIQQKFALSLLTILTKDLNFNPDQIQQAKDKLQEYNFKNKLDEIEQLFKVPATRKQALDQLVEINTREEYTLPQKEQAQQTFIRLVDIVKTKNFRLKQTTMSLSI